MLLCMPSLRASVVPGGSRGSDTFKQQGRAGPACPGLAWPGLAWPWLALHRLHAGAAPAATLTTHLNSPQPRLRYDLGPVRVLNRQWGQRGLPASISVYGC